MIGYLDPELLTCMDEISEMLRVLFQTKNQMTFAISATGSAGMEASFVNFVEPGDTVVIGVNGFFGDRMTEVADRCGAKVIRVDQEWGKIDRTRKNDQGLEGKSGRKDLRRRSC